MVTYLWIALGSVIGGVGRYWVNGWIGRGLGEAFPWGTLLINVAGSFAISLFAVLTGPDGRWLVHTNGRLFFMVGICGGFTTFSAFSLQTINLARDGDWAKAGWYVAASIVLCLTGAWLGLWAANVLNQGKSP